MTSARRSPEAATPAPEEVPRVDLRRWHEGAESDRDAFVQRLGDALRHFGFVRVAGHGVDASVVEPAYAAARAFFRGRREWLAQADNMRGWRGLWSTRKLSKLGGSSLLVALPSMSTQVTPISHNLSLSLLPQVIDRMQMMVMMIHR